MIFLEINYFKIVIIFHNIKVFIILLIKLLKPQWALDTYYLIQNDSIHKFVMLTLFVLPFPSTRLHPVFSYRFPSSLSSLFLSNYIFHIPEEQISALNMKYMLSSAFCTMFSEDLCSPLGTCTPLNLGSAGPHCPVLLAGPAINCSAWDLEHYWIWDVLLLSLGWM